MDPQANAILQLLQQGLGAPRPAQAVPSLPSMLNPMTTRAEGTAGTVGSVMSDKLNAQDKARLMQQAQMRMLLNHILGVNDLKQKYGLDDK
jgi:hypothetical protein